MPSVTITIENESGLHARPAALFVRAAGGCPCDLKVTNLTTGKGPVNAKSILSVLTLGVNQGHSIQIDAEGPGADEALITLQNLAAGNFGEKTA